MPEGNIEAGDTVERHNTPAVLLAVPSSSVDKDNIHRDVAGKEKMTFGLANTSAVAAGHLLLETASKRKVRLEDTQTCNQHEEAKQTWLAEQTDEAIGQL